jgi:hypothetical protein
MIMTTRDFIANASALLDRQGWLFHLIYKQRKPVTVVEIMELKHMKKPGGYLANDLKELVAWGFLEVKDGGYYVPLWVRQMVREALQNHRLKKHLQPAPSLHSESG